MTKQATRFSVHRGWRLLIADLGLDPAAVLHVAGLPPDLFVLPKASLSPAEYFNLWRGLERIAGADALPLKLGQAISIEAFDPAIFACLCSANLNAALRRLAQFKRLIGPMTLDLSIDARRTRIALACYGHVGELPRSLSVTELVFFTALARLATRRRIVPIKLELVQLPDDVVPYADYFGAPLRRGKVDAIAFAAADATLPFLTEDAALWTSFEPTLRQRLADLDGAAGIAERVRGVLLQHLPGGASSADAVAARLALSKRSLQRHLADADTNYQQVLDATRRELAEHYLLRRAVSLSEIAYLLGFDDGNSFLRAFKRWTGTTPGDYRERQRDAVAWV